MEKEHVLMVVCVPLQDIETVETDTLLAIIRQPGFMVDFYLKMQFEAAQSGIQIAHKAEDCVIFEGDTETLAALQERLSETYACHLEEKETMLAFAHWHASKQQEHQPENKPH